MVGTFRKIGHFFVTLGHPNDCCWAETGT